jgi:hypothetical protein
VRARGARRRKRPTAVRLGKILLAGAGSILLGWWVVQTSAVEALVRRRPAAAAMVAPDHPRVRIALAMHEFRLRGGVVGDAARRSVASAFARAPLTEEPFLLAGVAALADGREKEGEKLLEEARRRNPRARTARLILLDRYLRTDRAPEAGVEIAVLHRLIPRAAEVLIPELARMVRDPRTGASLIRVLSHDPEMQQAVLAQLASRGEDPDLILRIAGSSAATNPTPEGLPWQRLLLARLAEKGDVARAHRLWRSFSGLGPAGEEKGLYDSQFRGLPGAPPFNWNLVTGNSGVAERIDPPGLQVEYYGRLDGEFASQLLMLRPGRYRLAFRAQGAAKGEGSRLFWSVACVGSAAPLLQITIAGISYSPRVLAGEFTVPAAGCPGQWLRLKGAAGEFVDAQSVTISGLQLRRAGTP